MKFQVKSVAFATIWMRIDWRAKITKCDVPQIPSQRTWKQVTNYLSALSRKHLPSRRCFLQIHSRGGWSTASPVRLEQWLRKPDSGASKVLNTRPRFHEVEAEVSRFRRPRGQRRWGWNVREGPKAPRKNGLGRVLGQSESFQGEAERNASEDRRTTSQRTAVVSSTKSLHSPCFVANTLRNFRRRLGCRCIAR